MGSDSDYPCMKEAIAPLAQMGIPYETKIVSAHRTPIEMAQFAESAAENGFRVIIAGAGGAAHLPGMVAAHTDLPVIGVPVPIGPLSGVDALHSIVQMPRGVPVASVAIGNAYNAGLLAAKIIGFGGLQDADEVVGKLVAHRESMRQASLAKKLPKEDS